MAISNITMIKKKIGALNSLIEKEPIMLMSHTGEIWISEKAKNKLLEKNVSTAELLDWLKIGIKHLTEASYHALYTCMIQLPKNRKETDVLIILRDKDRKEMPELTIMEKKVLKYLIKGLSNKGIALNLNIKHGTVNTHLDNIYRKLGVSNRSSAMCTAIKLGIVVPAV